MTIAYVQKGAIAATSAPSLGGTFSTLTPALPAHSTGNLLLALVGIEATDPPVTVPAPSGWTQLAKTSATNRQVFLFGRVAASGAETDPTFDPTGEDGVANPPNNNSFLAQCFAFSGTFSLATLGALVSASSTPAPNATADVTVETGGSGAATLTVTDANTLVMFCYHWTNDASGQTTLTNFTTGDIQYTQLGNDGTIGWQYWIQTTATNVTNQQTTLTPVTGGETGQNVALMVSLKESGSAPAFTVPATVSSQTDTAYTLSFTPDSSSTIYGVAVIAGSAAPSIAQVKAGQNGAGAAAKASANKAVTGADTLVLTPSDSPAFPVYDMYCVLSNASGDSARRTVAGEYLDAPTGKAFTTLTSLDITSPFYGTGAAIADTTVTDTVTTPDGYAVTAAVDGTISYAAGGDNSRQIIAADVYDYSGGAYLGAGSLVFNNAVPIPSEYAFPEPLLLQKDVAMASLDLLVYVTDPEADVVVATALDALPTGLSITSSELSGTPTGYGETLTELQWEDAYGAAYTETVTIQVGDLVPDVINVVQATAVAAIEAVGQFTTTVTTASSGSIPTGNVISTDPVAGTLSPAATDVSVVVSAGSSLTITTTTLADAARDTEYSETLTANGSVTAWSVDAGNLPTGLALDNSTGVISGTPTVAGAYAFTIGATNGVASDTQALTLTITGIAPTITTTTLTRAIQDEAYSAQLAATGDATITYAVTTGLLPAGLSLSASGAITGTPTELGGNAFTVTATNAEGADTQALGLSVVARTPDYRLTLRARRNRINLRPL